MHNAQCKKQKSEYGTIADARGCSSDSSFRILRYTLLPLPCRVRGAHRRPDAAPHRKIADHRHAPGLAGRHQIVQNLVGDVLVEDSAVAELDDVILERLQLDAPRGGNV